MALAFSSREMKYTKESLANKLAMVIYDNCRVSKRFGD